jgi:hypothetical protein
MPEFIHSVTSKDIVDSVIPRIHQDWKAISIDGSSFDSSQYAKLQDIVENEFFRRIGDEIHEWCDFQCRDVKNARDSGDIAGCMMKSLLSTVNVMYVTLPGIDDDEWDERELADYRRETGDYYPRPWEYIARLEI